MPSVDKYANYSALQLITDAGFIAWVKCPDESSSRFWQEYINRYPSQAEAVAKAKAIVEKMRLETETMSEDSAAVSWNNISNEISRLKETNRTSTVIFMRRWAAAVAIIVLAGVAVLFFLNRKNPGREIAERHLPNTPIPVNTGKATLTLADGSVIILDSTNKGAISRQGDVFIVNMNGRLEYNERGQTVEDIVYNTITTSKGNQYELLLADGSRVWLNTESSLRFPTAFTGGERIVELTGEGYFEVKADAKNPFVVKKGNTKVTVLGTSFNVNSYEDEPLLKVTLLDGKVNVSNGSAQVSLKPGEQAVLDSYRNDVKILHNVDVEEAVAWKDGRFLFNSADIETVMRQIARWYDVEVVYESKITETLSGSLPRSENISQLLKILEAAGKVNFKINGKQIIVKRKY